MLLSRRAFDRTRARRRAGLSLIEVLLSMTIFFMAITAIARLVDIGTDRELDARLNNIGSRLAAAKLAEVEGGFTTLDSTQGQFENADSDWSWTMNADPLGNNLYNITVTVSRDFKGQQYSISMGQMMIDPTTKGSAAQAARPSSTSSSGGTP
jgi:Tfp pilus assembly protein PilV